jgi:hypothetical protein
VLCCPQLSDFHRDLARIGHQGRALGASDTTVDPSPPTPEAVPVVVLAPVLEAAARNGAT